ncbi:hypothetical protein DITRI_Ditri06bG0118200 [Diplodiscus trichospermus]
MAADIVLESSQVFDPSSSRSSIQPLGQGPIIVVPTIENVVSTVNLCCTLDLKAIAPHARNVEYNPEKFAAVVMSIKETKTTALIFSSGKMVCTGAKTEQHSRLAARKHARIIQKLGFDVKFRDFKIQNMVAAYDFTFPLDLIRLSTSHIKFTI